MCVSLVKNTLQPGRHTLYLFEKFFVKHGQIYLEAGVVSRKEPWSHWEVSTYAVDPRILHITRIQLVSARFW